MDREARALGSAGDLLAEALMPDLIGVIFFVAMGY
jgi:hypothetical protein